MSGSSSGNPVTTTTTQDTSPWRGQQPYLTQGFNQALNLYNSQQPQFYPGQTVAPFAPQTEQALGRIQQRATAGSPLDTAAQQGTLATAQGQYLNANPYLTQAMQPAISEYQRAVVPAIDSSFSLAGRYGSGAHQGAHANAQEALARGLSGIAFQNYGMERGYQNQALGQLPGMAQLDYGDPARLLAVGQTRQGQAQQQINSEIERFNFGQNVQAQKLAQYMGLIGGNYGGQMIGTQQQPTYNNPLAGILGGLLGLGGLVSMF